MRYFVLSCILSMASLCFAENEKSSVKSDETVCQEKAETAQSPLDKILENLNNRTKSLKTLESDVKFLAIKDPEILNSRELKKGKLYFKSEKNRSWIRIHFVTSQVDDEEEENRIENIVFDGIWLTMVDYENESVNKYEQAPEKEPIGAFDFINRNFPMIGFTKTEELKKDYNIKLIDDSKDDPNGLISINLKPKKESKHVEDYKTIDIWVSKKTFLPTKMVTKSTEDDVYELILTNVKVDKKMKNGVFVVETPKGFSENIEKLKKQ